jgi:hypothetical protein
MKIRFLDENSGIFTIAQDKIAVAQYLGNPK